MTEKPHQIRYQKKRLDAVDWYPWFLFYQAGMTAPQIAQRVGRSISRVYAQMGALGRLDAAGLAELREEALQRKRQEAEAELLVGDAARATRLLNGCTALRRAIGEERNSDMETRNAATPGENKEAKLSDAELELLRADLRRRYIPELPARAEGSDSGSGDGKSAGRTGP